MKIVITAMKILRIMARRVRMRMRKVRWKELKSKRSLSQLLTISHLFCLQEYMMDQDPLKIALIVMERGQHSMDSRRDSHTTSLGSLVVNLEVMITRLY
jgi:hypothetical protein